jgi:hypothetical protein
MSILKLVRTIFFIIFSKKKDYVFYSEKLSYQKMEKLYMGDFIK